MIKIIDYGMGNSGSILNMLKKLNANVSIIQDANQIDKKSNIILPGVGSFDNGATKLRDLGFDIAIKKAIENDKVFFLGICLGMHLLFEKSEEGLCEGLGLIPGNVIKFQPKDKTIKVPHMGWSAVSQIQSHYILNNAFENSRFYFVHSYHVTCDPQWIICRSKHGINFPSVVSKNNVYGVQFHPEKSHKFGLELLKRFVKADNGL